MKLMQPKYCSGIKCPWNNREPCDGPTCAKWEELIPATQTKASYGKCTAVVFIKEGEKIENVHSNPRDSEEPCFAGD